MKSLSQTEHEQIEAVIKKAGQTLKTYTKRQVQRYKNPTGLQSAVTQADIDTENFLLKEFKKLFPDIGFYSEETYQENPHELKKEYVWVVDPIDGTLNFSRGLPLFAISVALMYKQKPVAGHIYLPMLDEYFLAIKGNGSFLNEQKIKLPEVNPDTKWFGGWGSGMSSEIYRKFIEAKFELGFEGTQTYCAVYNYAYVAAGRFDFGMFFGLAIWDIAASWLLVEEAGGVFDIIHIDEERKKSGHPYFYWPLAGDESVVQKLKPAFKQLVLR